MWKLPFAIAPVVFFLTSCAASADGAIPSAKLDLQSRFRGVRAYILRVDATTPKRGVMIVSDRGVVIDSPSLLHLEKVDHLAVGSNFVVPTSIHVTWRTEPFEDDRKGGWSGGCTIGDYTIPVAERIPDNILDYIRKNGGALRLKIRLKDDGVLIGWDVEERYTTPYGRPLRYVLPGGDFQEATIFNGKVVDPGWQK